MNSSFTSSLFRVTAFWYVLGVLVLFLGHPDWVEARYLELARLPWVPELELDGLTGAAHVQWTLLLYWTMPVLLVWGLSVLIGSSVAEAGYRFAVQARQLRLKPSGNFWGVHIPTGENGGFASIGSLPPATTPGLTGNRVVFEVPGAASGKSLTKVAVDGPVREVLKMLSPAERQLSEQLLQVLMSDPDHFAGLGHGVGLLEHTLNVAVEAAPKCNPEFRLPFVAALAHDIGKLITFKPDGEGGWIRRGLHSRESARILATLPGFQELPEVHQRGLLLAVKYDHAPSKMPALRGDREASTLAMRIISALSSADKTATAAEKDRNLERIQPEDLLWKDFVDSLREAPVAQMGKKGASNQVNNPENSPFLFIYEAQWRDAAVRRMPAEVAAALDLTRRDAGKLAKYTRILTERLRSEGLLVEEHVVTTENGQETLRTGEGNPLWDIRSGDSDKAPVMRGVLVLRADELWRKLNYRLSIKSPWPVKILAPNAGADGKVNQAPGAGREGSGPDVSDGLKVADVQSSEGLAAVGLAVEAASSAPTKPKTRGRASFRAPASSPTQDATFGLMPEGAKPPAPRAVADERAGTAPAPVEVASHEAVVEAEGGIASVEAQPDTASDQPVEPYSMAAAMAFLNERGGALGEELAVDEGEDFQAPWDDPTDPSDGVSAVTAPMEVPAPAGAPVASPAQPAHQPKKPPKQAQRKVEDALAPAPQAVDLSRSERRDGIALADATAVARYPDLVVGDKYFTEEAVLVQQGHRKPGEKYQPGQESKKQDRKLELSESGPRRRFKRT